MAGDGGQITGTGESTRISLPSSVPGLPPAARRLARPLWRALALTCMLAGLAAALVIPASAAMPPTAPLSEAAPTPPPPDQPSPEDTLLLPDLMTLPPAGLEIRGSGSGRVLRFTNIVWNDGQGPLELNGKPDPATDSILVNQRAYTAGGVAVDWLVGEFVFHPTHAHWHLDGFVVYQLWSVNERGDLDRLIAGSGKVSYCLIDTDIVERDNPLRPRARQYSGCGSGRQGVSVGWGDTYLAYLDGQSLPLADAPYGPYALVSTANANRRIRETKISNNAGIDYILISGRQVDILSQGEIPGKRCLTTDLC